MKQTTLRRRDDATELGRQHLSRDMRFAEETLERLRGQELFESVPIGAPTEGGGILISAARFMEEIQNAYDLGIQHGLHAAHQPSILEALPDD